MTTGEFGITKTPEVHSDNDTAFLRQLTSADAQAYFDLIHYDRTHFKHGEEATSQKYQTVQDVIDSFGIIRPNYQRFGIWEGDVMVGSINLEIQEQDASTAEVGVWVGAEYAGNNYAARAERLISNFAFQDLGLKVIFGEVDKDNIASQKSLLKAGFTQVKSDDDKLRFELTSKEEIND
jgi:RimJ/RimL family protein N-acetyltransferase